MSIYYYYYYYYNKFKLLGIVKITVQEFGSIIMHNVKYLILRMSECQVFTVVYMSALALEPWFCGSHNSK